MKEFINIMKRFELKYCLSLKQLEEFTNRINEHMEIDHSQVTERFYRFPTNKKKALALV